MPRPHRGEERTFADYLSPRALLVLAGGSSYGRGSAYAAEGRVERLIAGERTIAATVRGGEAYAVRISATTTGLRFSCQCPMGASGAFCKHCVAVALAWNASTAPVADVGGPNERVAPGDADAATIRRAISSAVRHRGYIRYAAAPGLARDIHEAIDLIEGPLASDPGAAITLVEYALDRVERTIEDVDDSDGLMGDILRRLQDLHLRACAAARPDPRELAGRLFRREMTGDYDVFAGAAQTYAEILGPAGLAAYRELAEQAWSSVLPLTPRGRSPFDTDAHRFRITGAMEALARAAGDVDALIEIKQRDLSLAYRFLEIAELCQTHGRHDDALAWAERGLAAFPIQTDRRLREFLAEAYERRGRVSEALDVLWAEFAEHPDAEGNRLLTAHAQAAGRRAAWSERAIAHARVMVAAAKQEEATRPPRRSRWSGDRPADASPVVRILLVDGRMDEAWAEALADGCDARLWLEMAQARETAHPQDAIPVFQREVERLVDARRNDTYEDAARLVERIIVLLVGLRREDEADAYVTALAGRHGRKRNFMRSLNRIGG